MTELKPARSKTVRKRKVETTPVVPQTGLPEELVKAYNNVVAVASLSNVRVTETHFHTQPEYLKCATEDKTRTVPHWIFDEIGDLDFDAKAGFGRVVVQWRVGAGDPEPIMLMEASFEVTYVGLAGQDEEGVAMFLRRVGRFACYPYFRNFVSQLSWLSQADLPVLPILRDGRGAHPRGQKRLFPDP